MPFTLRDYQQKAHDLIISRFRMNKKTLLVMATGSGKSKTIISFIDKIKKHYIFILVVKNRKLVNQLAKDAKEFNLDYGVFMASHDEFDPSKLIQVCSIDTISSRGQHPHITTQKDIVLIIDEADQAKSSTYQAMINRYLNREAGKTFLLGMTATPYNGLDFFDVYINPITPIELRKRGFLVDYKYFIPKESIDYTDIIVSKGEWSAKQVSEKLNNPKMINNCFNSWLEYGDNRQTLVFCMDKKHAEAFCSYINDYYGKIQARFVYDKTSDDERNKIFSQFENGLIRFLINIRIITRGVDIPCIGTILDCAATLNVNLHIQKLGRGSRKNDFYKDCIVIDPAKNILNNGHFYQEREINLDEEYKRKKSDLDTISMRVCEKCFRAAEPADLCPFCGHSNKPIKKKKLSKYAENKLFMQEASEEAIEQRKMINDFKKTLWKVKNLGKVRYRNDIAREKALFKFIKLYGIEKSLKVKKSIGLTPLIVQKYKSKYEYVPLGGMNI